MKQLKLLKHGFCRLALLALAVCMLLPLLCACNGDQTSDPETPTDTATGEASVTLNGVPLGQYEIRYAWRESNKEHDQAKLIQETIKTTFGVTLKVDSDAKEVGPYVIMVGDSDRAGVLTSNTQELTQTNYMLTREGDTVYLLAKTLYGMQMATELFCTHITASSESRTVNISKGSVLSYADKLVNTMTFNIRNWSVSNNHLLRILATIRNNNYPDTIGFQEMSNRAGYAWIDKIMANTEFSDIYAWVGEDRGDSTGERAAIFYRKDKYRLVETGTKWMYGSDPLGSNTPGRLSIAPKPDSDIYYRVYTYAVLERISDGVRFAHINTHLDTASYYNTTEEGRSAQTKQLSYALAMAKKLHEENGYTVVLTGDFNCNSSSEPFKSITAAGFAWTEQVAKEVIGSEVNDKYVEENIGMCKGIDHIFLLTDDLYCQSYTICDQKISIRGNEDYASDHLARYATYIVD